jgi:hypothetical protein
LSQVHAANLCPETGRELNDTLRTIKKSSRVVVLERIQARIAVLKRSKGRVRRGREVGEEALISVRRRLGPGFFRYATAGAAQG